MEEEAAPTATASRRDACVVGPYLDPAYTAGPEGVEHAADHAEDHDHQQSSLALQGGDVHRDLYRIQAKAGSTLKRSVTLGATTTHSSSDNSANVEAGTSSRVDMNLPNGFRRQYLLRRQPSRLQKMNVPIAQSFVQFLDLYGGFAGENFADCDEHDTSDERRPLLPRRRTNLTGDASALRSFFTLIKAFIGTGILFLPKAFRNGGILFSSITLITISIVSYTCFSLLLDCRKKYKCGYGELGETIVGPWMRTLILSSIFISQMGFVCAGLIFTADNFLGFLKAVLDTSPGVSVAGLVGVQLILFVPLSWLRNMSKLGPVALIADVFIFFGLFYIWWYTISTLSTRGIDSSVVLFNPQDFALTVGSSIFTFEGVGLIIPIQSAMSEPQKFPKLLLVVMFIITVIFTSIGALCYATFGELTQVEIINNFPQSSPVVNTVQFLWALAVLAGGPVQLFPAIRVLEIPLFRGNSGKRSTRTKWMKNLFRTGLVFVCAGVSIAAASSLDKFVAFSGSFACVPLVYIYPPYLHLKGFATSRWAKALDLSILTFGAVAMIFTTGMNISKWF